MKKVVVSMAVAALSCVAGATEGVVATHAAKEVFSPEVSEWISVKDAPVFTGDEWKEIRAVDGTSWFHRAVTNAENLVSAKWSVSGLGVFDVFVNGQRVGTDFLKPGFTHGKKTKYAFTYDVTDLMKSEKGGVNDFAAEVSAGWWRDKIVNFVGKKSAFRGELVLEYANGTRQVIGTRAADWASGIAGAVMHAAIFDGEEYDARQINPTAGQGLTRTQTEVNREFEGEVLPSPGAEVVLREDLAMKPIEAYTWKGVTDATTNEYGRVVRTHTFMPGEVLSVRAGETLVADFGQNCAGVPRFRFRAEEGTILSALPAEMLNDYNGSMSRGNDGPEGSVYRINLRSPNEGMRIVYIFGKGDAPVTYLPRFTFFGYRYISITATRNVVIESLESVPVSSVTKEMESGKIEVGDPDLNRFLKNVYWGQLSNYLSVPTDCPQRNERLGWSADTQVFCEAGSFNADTRRFFAKFTRDLRDNRCKDGGFSSVAPLAQYGNETFAFGWADVGVIVPWTIWKHYGDTQIVKANWDAMVKFVKKLDETKYNFEGKIGYIYADWLSFETFETFGNRFGNWKKWKDNPDARNYRLFLAACYWLYDAQLMSEMGAAIGKTEDVAFFKESAARAREYIRRNFVEADGLLLKPMRGLQTACAFALKFGIVEGAAKAETKKILLDSIAAHDGCLQTGFLGTSFLMEVLAQEKEWDAAYGLLLQHNNPSWLYSVDQGATTVWERWDSYTKKNGFGEACMNSFNHYAYGAVAAWVYRNVAGIASDPAAPGFKRLILAPKPDRRLGYVTASYRSVSGEIKSAWRYEGDKWLWDFTIPEGVTAEVHLPNGATPETLSAGTYHRELSAQR